MVTLDSEWIADVSRDTYTVGTTGTITQARYERYLSIVCDPRRGRATKDGLLATDASGNVVIETGNEYLVALLVCDKIKSGEITDAGVKSESFGGAYSYSKTDDAAGSVKSFYLLLYEEELAQSRKGSQPSIDIDRSDKVIEFAKLSQGNPPQVEDSSEDFPEMM